MLTFDYIINHVLVNKIGLNPVIKASGLGHIIWCVVISHLIIM